MFESRKANNRSSDFGAKVLTFDLEDWFHLIDAGHYSLSSNWDEFESRLEPMVEAILNSLAEHRTNATFFVLGWVAERFPSLIRQIVNAGHSIGCHSHLHKPVTDQTQDEFRSDLIEALAAIEAASGVVPIAYRAPGFSITRENLWAFDVLVEEGIEVDCSIFMGEHAHGGLSGLNLRQPFRLETLAGYCLKCFPLTTLRLPLNKSLCFSGGGYFRLLPFSLIDLWFSRHDYVMTYFHPRDFDAQQPPIHLSPLRSWRTMVGVQSSMPKLNKLLKKHYFENVVDLDQRLDWKGSPLVYASSLLGGRD